VVRQTFTRVEHGIHIVAIEISIVINFQVKIETVVLIWSEILWSCCFVNCFIVIGSSFTFCYWNDLVYLWYIYTLTLVIIWKNYKIESNHLCWCRVGLTFDQNFRG